MKELFLNFNFSKLYNGHYAMTNMEVRGRVKILFVINIRFKVIGKYYDFKLPEAVENEN